MREVAHPFTHPSGERLGAEAIFGCVGEGSNGVRCLGIVDKVFYPSANSSNLNEYLSDNVSHHAA